MLCSLTVNTQIMSKVVLKLWLWDNCLLLKKEVIRLLHFLLHLTFNCQAHEQPAASLWLAIYYMLLWCFAAFKELLHKSDLTGSSDNTMVGTVGGYSITISHRGKEK